MSQVLLLKSVVAIAGMVPTALNSLIFQRTVPINACLWNNRQWLLIVITYQGFLCTIDLTIFESLLAWLLTTRYQIYHTVNAFDIWLYW